MLAAAIVNVPLPLMVSVPAVLVFKPPDKVALPAPETVSALPVPVTLPSVNKVPLAGEKVEVVPVSVVAPKVRPAVPLLTFAPLLIVKVFVPMLKVPRVCVMPAPLLAKSEVIVALPPTVVLYAVMLLFV